MTDETKPRFLSDPPEGRYANHFRVGYNDVELVIDCGQCYSDNDDPQLHTRIITSVAYGKALLKTLQESLDQHKKTYGPIKG